MRGMGGWLVLAVMGGPPVSAQRATLPLPPVAGFSLVQTLTTKEGDRESVHTVKEASARALRWSWTVIEVLESGDTLRQAFNYAELHADVAEAFRFRAFHDLKAPEEHPGYTMHALSRAVYRRLRAEGSASFQVMAIEAAGAGLLGVLGQNSPTPVRWRGTLTLASRTPVPFPLLLNSRRVEVPALHLRARLAARSGTWEPEFWVLADSTYPLLLKWVGAHRQAGNVLQTIRVDLATAATSQAELERELSTTCRADLPGVYF